MGEMERKMEAPCVYLHVHGSCCGSCGGRLGTHRGEKALLPVMWVPLEPHVMESSRTTGIPGLDAHTGHVGRPAVHRREASPGCQRHGVSGQAMAAAALTLRGGGTSECPPGPLQKGTLLGAAQAGVLGGQ